jgi:hypothetical protein
MNDETRKAAIVVEILQLLEREQLYVGDALRVISAARDVMENVSTCHLCTCKSMDKIHYVLRTETRSILGALKNLAGSSDLERLIIDTLNRNTVQSEVTSVGSHE